ncbi:MAG: 2-dehydro-3-deoxygalactonokinase [Acidisphaera sp.]|nr:2-dehydro-3-deoxygalactonokinase [Acidisphaera sp.]MBV9813495.1 2-dehydro-3-deoxygalactonokinase [Acetobacteraceae bacterium]
MIGVDWGTSSFRAFRISPDGRITDRVATQRGIMTVGDGGFAPVLRQAIGSWLEDGERHVLLSGMIGSRQGWREAPYLPCPAGPREFAAALLAVPFDGAQTLLVPGLSDADETGVPEVMRGEETQIAGILPELASDAVVCLPGSHSKWARVANGRISGYRTYLSGEAFAALRTGTILGRMMADATHDPAAFAQGLARAAEPGHLLHHLFGVRTLALSGELAETATASYLSGLLIGHEVAAALEGAARVFLVGGAALTALYAQAILAAGATPIILSEDAAAAGLALIGAHAPWT